MGTDILGAETQASAYAAGHQAKYGDKLSALNLTPLGEMPD